MTHPITVPAPFVMPVYYSAPEPRQPKPRKPLTPLEQMYAYYDQD